MRQIWTSDEECTLDGVRFRYPRERPRGLHKTSPEEVVVLKPRAAFEWYARRLGRFVARNVVELGNFEGGSAMLLADILPEAKFVALDKRRGNPEVARHVEALGLAERISFAYGVSQEDDPTVAKLVDDAFGGERLDLVVDDCSHRYGPTRASFEHLFPRLRPGGLYIIEDWGWAHWRDWDGPDFLRRERTSLSSLVLELVMASASSPSIVRKVETTSLHAVIERGPAKVQTLNVESLIELQGREWRAL